MITVQYQNNVEDRLNKVVFQFRGLSTDEKPTVQYGGVNIANGSEFFEMDKEDMYYYNEATTNWVGTNGGGGGTTDYEDLSNKPSINGVTLEGALTGADLELGTTTIEEDTNIWELAVGEYLVKGGSNGVKLYYKTTGYNEVGIDNNVMLYVWADGTYAILKGATDNMYHIVGQAHQTQGTTEAEKLWEEMSNKVTSISNSSTDMQYPSAKCVYDELTGKQDVLTAGTGITITDNVISSTGGGASYTAGDNIDITDNEISVSGILPYEVKDYYTNYVEGEYYAVVDEEEYSIDPPTEAANTAYLKFTNNTDDDLTKTFTIIGKNTTSGSATVFIVDDMDEFSEIVKVTGTYSSPTEVQIDSLSPDWSVIFNFTNTDVLQPQVYESSMEGALTGYIKTQSNKKQTIDSALDVTGTIRTNQSIVGGSFSTSELYVSKVMSNTSVHNVNYNSVALGAQTMAKGRFAFAEGSYTSANRKYQHAEGQYNIEESGSNDDVGTLAHIVGNGTANNARSNAYTLDWSGNGWFSGDVYVGSTSGTNKDAGSKKLATEDYVTTAISTAITSAISASY